VFFVANEMSREVRDVSARIRTATADNWFQHLYGGQPRVEAWLMTDSGSGWAPHPSGDAEYPPGDVPVLGEDDDNPSTWPLQFGDIPAAGEHMYGGGPGETATEVDGFEARLGMDWPFPPNVPNPGDLRFEIEVAWYQWDR
jgi:hypothetical protein